MGHSQHVYRRGHIFWWRRSHRLNGDSTVEVRLSLGTADRLQARNRGAALTATSPKVVEMLDQRARMKLGITDRELQAIAKAMYEERLSEVSIEQRATPYLSEHYSAINRGFVDYFQRLMSLGGHMSLLPEEEDRLRQRGWDDQRLADLRTIIGLREDKGVSPIRTDEIDRHLAAAGYPADDRLRLLLEQALYPAYRDAYAEAESRLQALFSPIDRPATVQPDHALAAAGPTARAGTDQANKWMRATPSEVAEAMISENPRLLKHRQSGKRAAASVGNQTLRQILWAAVLLEKSLPEGTPLCEVTKDEILALDQLFDQIPIHFGKSIHDRDPGHSLSAVASDAAAKIEAGELSADDVGFSVGTANKHYNKLGQIHKFLRGKIDDLPVIDFTEFTAAIDKDEREARLRYSREQGEAIFNLPPWKGCAGVEDRLAAGPSVFHDGLSFMLLLVWYTGARREELCKLMLDDVETRHGIPYLLIRPTETGRVKNLAARRVVVIADELVRLGFLRYVDAMRRADERLLFPEFMPGGEKTQRKLGDVFYKLWWIYIKPKVPDLKRGQAMHAARHMVSDELKDQEVFIEFRNDHLGHKGTGGEGVTRYPSASSLQRLSGVVAKIPIVTSHLPDQNDIRLLPKTMRAPRPTRATNRSNEEAE